MALAAQKALHMASRISLVLAGLKGLAFAFTGSVVVLGAFLDSVADSLISWSNGKINKKALEDADREHPYGHGGYEILGGLVQGFVISIVAGVLIFESLQRLFKPQSGDLTLAQLPLGLAILVFGSLAGLFISTFLRRYLKKLADQGESSVALEADIAHYLSDFWMNGLAALGLFLVFYFEKSWLDALCGLVGGGMTARSAIPVLTSVYRAILHSELDVATQKEIVQIAKDSDERIEGVHRLRTRRLGPIPFADFHLKLPAELNLKDAHEIEETIRARLQERFPKIDLYIHMDPDSEPDDNLWEPHFR